MTSENSNTVKLEEVAPDSNGQANSNGHRQAESNGSKQLNFQQLLDLLCIHPDEYVSVCRQPVGGKFTSSVVHSREANKLAERVKQDKDVWFGVNTLNARVFVRSSGRGYERDVVRWTALYNDLDVKQGAFTSTAHAREYIDKISGFIGQYPSAIIHSGHGLQPLWPIGDGELDTPEKFERAYVLSHRFRRFAADVARQHFDTKLDTVGDLARVLRVPGTTNHKDRDNPVPTGCEEGVGNPLTLDGIEAFLDKWAPEIESDKPVKDEQGNFAEQVSDPYEWTPVDTTCPYVRKMPEGWRTDKPKSGRHPAIMSHCVRLASALRGGCISEDDLDNALTGLEWLLRWWCSDKSFGAPRALKPDEVGSAFRWGVTKVSTFDDDRCRQELGGHHHGKLEDEKPEDGDKSEDNRSGRPEYVDIAALLAGGLPEPPDPLVLKRQDGKCLFYKAKSNIVFGDSEVGKTWIAWAACVEALNNGEKVGILDLDHNGPGDTAAALLSLGAPVEALSDQNRFLYIEPDGEAEILAVVEDFRQYWKPDGVVLVDSITEIMGMLGKSSNSSDDYVVVNRMLLEPMARTGAAAIGIDHPARNKESRDMGPSGAVAKRNTVSGVSLRVKKGKQFIRGKGGTARLSINKDRPGGLRAHCPPPDGKGENGEQKVGTFILPPPDADGKMAWSLIEPFDRPGITDCQSDYLDAAQMLYPQWSTLKQIAALLTREVTPTPKDIQRASDNCAALVDRGWLEYREGRRGAGNAATYRYREQSPAN